MKNEGFKEVCNEIIEKINNFKYRALNSFSCTKTADMQQIYDDLVKEHRLYICKFLAMREACSWLKKSERKIFLKYLKGIEKMENNECKIIERRWKHLKGIYKSLTELNIKKYC